MRNDSDKSCREIRNAFYLRHIFFEGRAVHDVMWKNTVEPDRPQMTNAHCILDTLGYRHTLRICNTYCFSTENDCTNASQGCVLRTLPVCSLTEVESIYCAVQSEYFYMARSQYSEGPATGHLDTGFS